MARNYHQGKYTCRNPKKYIGDVNNIVYRSGWEKKTMLHFDTHPGILKWSSEETVIPYFSLVDNKMHRYFIDFTVMFKSKDGKIRRALVEVKPFAQTQPPVKKTKTTNRYLTECMTYSVNTSKWAAATKWGKEHGFEFIIITEKELGL